ncbi:hypothetical protein HDR63_03325, partial [bacterium]|nr:hypothetical protein [bacterium]
MRKVASCLFLMMACASGAWAATASRALPSSGASTTTDTARTADTATPMTTASRTTVSRGVVTSDAPVSARESNATSTASTTVSRTAASTTSSGATTATPSRGSAARSATAATARDNLDAAVHTVGRNARVTAASLNSSAAVRRAGVSLRPSTAEVGGRATIGTSGVQTGSNIGDAVRSVQSRAAVGVSTTQTLGTRESIAEAKERLEQVADLNKSCQEQYNDCMDQFCAVIDANQKRCSCSANLSRYTRVESAVKEANTQLNEVAQRIRYVGLSADEIRAIMSATEAEDALTGARDTTESRNMLDEIEALIVSPTSTSSASSTNTNSLSDLLDADLSFSG